MSVGKVCAQIAHGAQMFAFEYIARCMRKIESGLNFAVLYYDPKLELTKKWKDGSFRKVVLGGKAKDFEKLKNELDVFLVRDAGLTKVERGTETVLVTWPQLRSECPKILKRLRVLNT